MYIALTIIILRLGFLLFLIVIVVNSLLVVYSFDYLRVHKMNFKVTENNKSTLS